MTGERTLEPPHPYGHAFTSRGLARPRAPPPADTGPAEIALPPASPNPRPEVPPPSRSGAFLAAHWLRGPSVPGGRGPGHGVQFQAPSHPVPGFPSPRANSQAPRGGEGGVLLPFYFAGPPPAVPIQSLPL